MNLRIKKKKKFTNFGPIFTTNIKKLILFPFRIKHITCYDSNTKFPGNYFPYAIQFLKSTGQNPSPSHTQPLLWSHNRFLNQMLSPLPIFILWESKRRRKVKRFTLQWTLGFLLNYCTYFGACHFIDICLPPILFIFPVPKNSYSSV